MSESFFDVVNRNDRFKKLGDGERAIEDRLVFVFPTEKFREGGVSLAQVITYVRKATDFS